MRKAWLVVVVTGIVVIGIIAATFVFIISPEPGLQYEGVYEYRWDYDGPGKYHEDRFFFLSWSPGGTHLASNFGASGAAFWNDTNGGELKTVDLPVYDPHEEGNAFWDVKFNPHLDVAAVGWYEGLAFYDLEGNLLSEIRGRQARSVAWSPLGDEIAVSWVDDGTSSISLDVLTYPNLIEVYSRNIEKAFDVLEWSPDSSHLIGCTRWHNPLVLFDRELQERRVLIEDSLCHYMLSWSPDSSTVLVPAENGLILLDVESAEERHVIPQSSQNACGTELGFAGVGLLYSGAYSPSGDMIAVGHYNGLVEVWSGDGKNRIDTLLFRPCVTSPPKDVYSVKWSPTGEKIAATGEHGVTVWEAGE
ncbi:MAG: WD40 repeat domain-containing protein [Methanobacteriota archaeon]|nr:MAG: WD40 repeat domain-containing protein [Euryarchaeota archaeon]